MQGKEELKEVAEHRKWLHRRPWQLHMGDESSPEQGLQTNPHGGSGLKMRGNKEQGKGTGFTKGMPTHPTGNKGEKRMLNEPMISADHPGFIRRTAKDARTAEPPLGTNGLTEENISEIVGRLKDTSFCLFFSRLTGHVSLTVCLSLGDSACLFLHWTMCLARCSYPHKECFVN